jgi:GNAT superfamily N-acetyltransferase
MENTIHIRQFNEINARDLTNLQLTSYMSGLQRRGLIDNFNPASLGNDVVTEWHDYYRTMFDTLRDDPLFANHIAFMGDQPIGCATTYSGERQGFKNYGVLDAVCVHPEYWGRGIGRRLAESSNSFLKDKGASASVLHVEKDDPHARKFWGKLGWKPIPGHFGWNEIMGRTYSIALLEKNL